MCTSFFSSSYLHVLYFLCSMVHVILNDLRLPFMIILFGRRISFVGRRFPGVSLQFQCLHPVILSFNSSFFFLLFNVAFLSQLRVRYDFLLFLLFFVCFVRFTLSSLADDYIISIKWVQVFLAVNRVFFLFVFTMLYYKKVFRVPIRFFFLLCFGNFFSWRTCKKCCWWLSLFLTMNKTIFLTSSISHGNYQKSPD